MRAGTSDFLVAASSATVFSFIVLFHCTARNNEKEGIRLGHSLARPQRKHPDIILALGNGHAFKFAPAIGRVVAELAIDGQTSDDISKFPVPSPAGSSKL